MEKLALIFDLDGTLWDASQPVAESWSIVGKDYISPSFTLSAEAVRREMGKTMDEIVDDVASDMDRSLIQEFSDRLLGFELEYMKTHPGALFPKEIETLLELKKQGHRLFIVSNCQHGYIECFLPLLPEGLIEDYACWSDTLATKDVTIRFLMDRNKLTHAAYVGDIQKDEDSTHKAGLPFIHASYGYGTSSDPQAVLKTFSDLLEVVKTL